MSTRLTYTSGSAAPETDAQFEAALEAVRSGPADRSRTWSAAGARRRATCSSGATPRARTRSRARAHAAPPALVAEAIERARAAQVAWRRMAPSDRCALLRRVGEAIGERHMAMAAAVSMEAGKSRTESIAEVQEAIDLIEAYCEQMERHGGYRVPLGQLSPEETNESILRPFGVFGVIGPFNFPVALVVGMAAGALVAGNTVVVKPSEQTPLSGALIGECFVAAGLPEGVVSLVHGGEETGRALAEGAIDGVVFTGSAEVGRALGGASPDGPFARPAITEMGGKNPAIVAASADVDAAAAGIASSAFGFSGQKCSACSRAIVVDPVYDALVSRARGEGRRARDRRPGRRGRVHRAGGRRAGGGAVHATPRGAGGTVVAGGRALDLPGPLRGADGGGRRARRAPARRATSSSSRSSRSRASAPSRRRWRRRTPSTTGSPRASSAASGRSSTRFLDRIEAGVVYVNRRAGATTGAWPGFQSFCGWKSSGSTGKGGLGPYYVAQFMREQSRTIVSV